MDLPGDLPSPAARGAGAIHRAFDEHHRAFRAITGRVRRRFEARDWDGIRHDTLERIELPARSLARRSRSCADSSASRLCDHGIWGALKAELHPRDPRARRLRDRPVVLQLPHPQGLPARRRGPGHRLRGRRAPRPLRRAGRWRAPACTPCAASTPAWCAGCWRTPASETPFRDLDGDAALAAERLGQGDRRGVRRRRRSTRSTSCGRSSSATRGPTSWGAPAAGRPSCRSSSPSSTTARGSSVDAALCTEDEASVVFSFARWYFHVDVDSPREVIGFLQLDPAQEAGRRALHLPRLQEARQDRALPRPDDPHRPGTDEPLRRGAGGRRPGDGGLQPPFLRVRVQDHQGRLPAAEEHHAGAGDGEVPAPCSSTTASAAWSASRSSSTSPSRAAASRPSCWRSSSPIAGRTVSAEGDDVAIRHCYVERRVVPLDLYLREMDAERAEAAAVDWGRCLKELAAANIFPGDVLLKNFGVTRHGRVLSYDYDELCPLVGSHLPRGPAGAQRGGGDGRRALVQRRRGRTSSPPSCAPSSASRGARARPFCASTATSSASSSGSALQERLRRGEVLSFYPYDPARRLRRESSTIGLWIPAPS